MRLRDAGDINFLINGPLMLAEYGGSGETDVIFVCECTSSTPAQCHIDNYYSTTKCGILSVIGLYW